LLDKNGKPVLGSDGNPVYVDKDGLNALADAATRANVGSTPGGRCYSNVKNILAAAGMVDNANDLRGNSSFGSAYMAVSNLTNLNTPGYGTEPYSWQVSGITDPKSAPPGSVVVWDRGPGHPDGHIAVIDNNGNQVSDFRSPNMSNMPLKAILIPVKRGST
jgi:hypothetical protein